jgi:ABC-type bacteriocin/lantibiotic exporter with double-glycine peptidase domain
MIRVVALITLIAACTVPYKGGARAVHPTQLGAGWVRAVDTPVIKQKHRTDCGLAALAMVGGAWGRSWSVDELAHHVKAGENGIKLGVLRNLAREHGLEAYTIRATRADLKFELSHGRPVLLGLMLPHERNASRSHFEVAIALNTNDGTIITIDPATGDWMRRSPDALDAEWKAAGYAALVVTGDKTRAVVGAARENAGE